jgi:hypothetical protein
MALERRGCGSLHGVGGQPAMGGAGSLCIALVSRGIGDRAARSRMNREVHVRSLWGTGGETPPVYPASPR